MVFGDSPRSSRRYFANSSNCSTKSSLSPTTSSRHGGNRSHALATRTNVSLTAVRSRRRRRGRRRAQRRDATSTSARVTTVPGITSAYWEIVTTGRRREAKNLQIGHRRGVVFGLGVATLSRRFLKVTHIRPLDRKDGALALRSNKSEDCAVAHTSPEPNKALVLEAFDALFNRRDYAAAERYWCDRYI
jgi:hypothetical protein